MTVKHKAIGDYAGCKVRDMARVKISKDERKQSTITSTGGQYN